MGLFFFFFHNWARNQLPLDINGAELIQKLIFSQTMTGLFCNPQSPSAIRIHCKPQAMAGVIQVWSDGKGHAKANQTPGSSCSRGVFRALDGAIPQKNSLCLWSMHSHHCYDYGIIHTWRLFIYFLLSENALIRPFPKDRRKQRTLDRKNGEQNL